MRTPKQLYPRERIIYQPELSTCPHCAGPLVLYNYLAWHKTVQTLDPHSQPFPDWPLHSQ